MMTRQQIVLLVFYLGSTVGLIGAWRLLHLFWEYRLLNTRLAALGMYFTTLFALYAFVLIIGIFRLTGISLPARQYITLSVWTFQALMVYFVAYRISKTRS